MKSAMSSDGWKTMAWIIDWERDTHSFEDFVEAATYPDYDIPRNIPVTVMARGIPHVAIRSTGMSYADVDAYTITWDRAMLRQTAISDDVDWVVMRYASHFFDGMDPWIVIDHLEKMVVRVGVTRQSR